MRRLIEAAIKYDSGRLFRDELGYAEIIMGPDIAPDGVRPQEREFDEVVLRERLIKAIGRINSDLLTEAREDVVRKVIRAEAADVLANNQAFHRLLSEGVDVDLSEQTRRSAYRQSLAAGV